MISTTHCILMIAVMVLITVALRFTPFLVFSGNRKTPAYITYLGKVLPYAIMGMLVVFCLKSTPVLTAPHGLPELMACAAVVGLHVWRRNTLLSVLAGMVLYMILVQFVFI